jgi:hypothetical protein
MTVWRLLPEDLFTHLHDWRTACEHMLSNAPRPTEDQDDAGYWQKQLNTLDKIEAECKAYDKRVADAEWSKRMDDANRAAGVDLL